MAVTPAGRTQHKTVGERQCARANNRLFASDDLALNMMNTDNDLEMEREVEQKKLPKMAKVHNVLEMWQGSQNLHAKQNESRAQNQDMTAVEYISDTEKIVKTSWSYFQHDGADAFKLLGISPVPAGSSAKTHPGARTQLFNVR